MWYTVDMIAEEGTEEEFVELERETVRELAQMYTLYKWNTAFTLLGALAGWIAMVVIALVWLLT